MPAGLAGGDGKPEAEAAEPLAEWEQELLASATATAAPADTADSVVEEAAEEVAVAAADPTPSEG